MGPPMTCTMSALEASGSNELLLFESGTKVRCPACRSRLGDAIGARVRVRLVTTGSPPSGPALVQKCEGHMPLQRGIRGDLPCGRLLEITLLPKAE